jgi:pyruvate formate lyase activating enzyme
VGVCKVCGKKGRKISSFLSVCKRCILERRDESFPLIEEAHRISRERFGLPSKPPKCENGIKCFLCGNECKIGEGEIGYCGLREKNGEALTFMSHSARLDFYHDPLPTNCVADWVCAGGTGSGYPYFAYTPHAEYGYKNLAVFFSACSFNCLYCQNWHFRLETRKKKVCKEEDLIKAVDEKTSCVCFFGGDPSCQLPFAISFSKMAMEKKEGRILRICFETNGFMNPELLDAAFDLCLKTGGCIKFDLKAWDRSIHKAITGAENELTLKNFMRVAERFSLRPDPPPVVASTLIVPGYVEDEEVAKISRFIARINREIPYTLLAFYPHFYMEDLPFVSKELAQRCLDAAKSEGLKRVRIGNFHLLV